MEQRDRGAVQVIRAAQPVLAPAADGLERQVVAEVPRDRQGVLVGVQVVEHLAIVGDVPVVSPQEARVVDSAGGRRWKERLLEHEGRVVLLGCGPVIGVVDGHVFRGQPAQREAPRPAVLVVEVVAVEVVVVDGTLLDARHRDAGRQRLADQRNVHGRVEVPRLVLAERELRLGAEVRPRLHGDDVDGTAHGVAPEERALGAAKDLDPLDVDQIKKGRVPGPDVHTVDVEADP